MMTSFAFILGVVPLVLSAGRGAEMRRTLGTAVFAGMLGVTLFGIFLTPVFYYVIQWFAERRRRRRRRDLDPRRRRPPRQERPSRRRPRLINTEGSAMRTIFRSRPSAEDGPHGGPYEEINPVAA